jgi:DNA-binding NtrC family response regulator
VRLIAATNKDLAKMVEEGVFREDLFFRLHVVPLRMPPLREHPDDIPLLVNATLKEMEKEHGKPGRPFSKEASRALETYAWPGNIRELRAAVEHAVVLGSDPRTLELKDLPTSLQGAMHGLTLEENLDLSKAANSLIHKALDECSNNRTLAAKKLGISRRTLHRQLAKQGITKKNL